ncbi:ParB/RepB/Spo0J family partition protein [Streptomyces cellulosae]|uniref:ParB/RepB/Spo0J family partition protein n=1 Tax=Streptomyces cellulosae TaxID=1968 RepID=A0ABW6JKQ5_STRCE
MAGSLKRAKRTAPPKAAPAGPKFYELSTEADGDSLTISLADITPNPFNDRDMGDVSRLAASIAKDGMMQDIAVMHTEVFAQHHPDAAEGITTKYVIAFGERRWRAHNELERPSISAILRNDLAPNIARVLFSENFHRKQLSPIEEARKFRAMNDAGMSYRDIAEELSLKSQSHVARRMELLRLPVELQEIVGTEDGPGVTQARDIARHFDEPEQMLRAWELIRDQGLTVNQAVDEVLHGGGVPQGNSAGEAEFAGTIEVGTEPAGVPQGNAAGTAAPTAPEAGGVPQGNTAGADAGAESAAGVPQGNAAEVPQPRAREAVEPSAGSSKPSTAARPAGASERDTVQRTQASADRDAACRHLVETGLKLTQEQQDALFGRTLLAASQHGPARTRAHRWLREAGVAEYEIADTDGFFAAVLASNRPDLVHRVALATAVAVGEIRARDGRRPWDRSDAEHVRLLIETTNYVPETSWERSQLEKFGVTFPGADQEPDAEPIL